MNLVIDDAVEVKQATKAEEMSRRELGNRVRNLLTRDFCLSCVGRILLKGDNVSLIQSLQS